MKVRVTFTYSPEPEEIDAADPSGLTEAAWDDLAARLMEAGAEDIRVKRETSA
jgi:hypothetical protein